VCRSRLNSEFPRKVSRAMAAAGTCGSGATGVVKRRWREQSATNSYAKIFGQTEWPVFVCLPSIWISLAWRRIFVVRKTLGRARAVIESSRIFRRPHPHWPLSRSS
jgi:hypothetical protein